MRQALLGAALLAFDRRRIEMATGRIADQTILQPVLLVAGCDGGLVNQWIFLRGDETSGVFQRVLRHPKSLSGTVCPVQNRRAGGDTVVIVRKSLRFFQPLLTS